MVKFHARFCDIGVVFMYNKLLTPHIGYNDNQLIDQLPLKL